MLKHMMTKFTMQISSVECQPIIWKQNFRYVSIHNIITTIKGEIANLHEGVVNVYCFNLISKSGHTMQE